MTHQTLTFTIADPRTFDGDPYEVAERAVAQAEALVKLLDTAIHDAYVMSRNAELERQLQRGEDANAQRYEEGPYGKRFASISLAAKETISELTLLRRAAGFNPRGKIEG